MRIALLTEAFLPKFDGVVKSLCHLLDYLADHGHESVLLAPEGSPPQYAATPVVQMKSHRLIFYPEFRLVLPAQDIAPELDDFNPDLIHLISPFSLGLLGANYSRKKNIPLVASYQTDLPGYLERWGVGFLSQSVEKYLYWLHKQAQLNLAPSRVTQNELIQKGYPNVRLWTRGINSMLYNPNHYDKDMRDYLSDGNSNATLLLYVGRLSREKRVEMLRPALDVIPNVRLAIVGDGPFRDDLERIYKNSPVKFTGYLFGEELAKAYASADIFVFTGANETFGNVVLEAMASGLPVVAPNSGGVMDMVKPYETGILFESENQESLVNAVQQMVVSRGLREQTRIEARKMALSFSWEDILKQLMADYEKVIDTFDPETKIREGARQPFTDLFQIFR
jgi:glycosyltransferase involved in cell wall biosynthesis